MSIPIFKILIIDDNPDESSVYGWYLTKIKDFKVTLEYAESGAAGLKKLAAGAYDLVILDYQMPHMNGLEMLKALRDTGDATPVVMMTGGGGERVAVESLKSGAIDYVLKEDLPKTDFGGLIRRAIEVARLKADKKELERVTALKNEFLELLSRDLQVPLVTAFGVIEMMQTERMGRITPEQRDGLGTIQREVQRLYDFIEDLVNLREFALEPGQLALKKMSLKQLVQERVEAHRRFFEQKGITLDASWEDDVLELDGDRARLSCVIDNVLSNALNSTRFGGNVGVLCKRQDGRAVIAIADTGKGLSIEQRQHLFDTFFRSDRRLINRYEGLGIGLAVSKHIAEAHGGDLKVSSDGPDKGVIVTLTLPLVSATVVVA